MDLLFEIGCEELPAGFQKPALEWMAAEMNRSLDDARLNGEGEAERANIQEYATPRRLTLVVTAIAERAPDVRRTLQGPPAKAAFLDGKPLAVQFADVKSGTATRGHRFHAPREFQAPPARRYVEALREAHVITDWAERK